ncbi:MAG: 2-oxoglutarate and iron-dependent oxygenase domain-containing protein [Pseudomonadota bacterium]
MTDHHLDPELIAKRLPLEEIPVIDLAPFLGGTVDHRQEVAQEIGRACRHIGFFYVIHHGVPQALIDETFAQAKRFFDLPDALKQEISIERSAAHRGYFSLGGENLDPAKQTETGDFKEGLKIGRDLPLDHPLVQAGTPLHGPNLWPADLPGWRETIERCYGALSGLGFELMRGFALALELPGDFFDDKLTEPMATLGPLHYPPHQGPVSERRLGAGAHTDFGCLTILSQDPVGGLQVMNAAGQWIDAPFIPGSFVVNIGDMMARWTNDIFASTRHRVINLSGSDRYSMPFFYDPNFEAEVACLETCQSADRPPRYPPTTGGQHLLDMINATFDYRHEAPA